MDTKQILVVVPQYGSAYGLAGDVGSGELTQYPMWSDGRIDGEGGAVDFDRIPGDERDFLRTVAQALDSIDSAAIAAGMRR